MRNVNREELLAMVDKAADCASTVSDADVDAIAYACLVAVMTQGSVAHVELEKVIGDAAPADNVHPAEVVSSAGVLVRTLRAIGARKVTIVTPYLAPLTDSVARSTLHGHDRRFKPGSPESARASVLRRLHSHPFQDLAGEKLVVNRPARGGSVACRNHQACPA